VPLVQIVFVDKRGEESFVPPMSDPRPHVVLDPVTSAGVTLSADGTQMDVRIAGTVTDSLADIVPNHTADITRVTVADQSLAVQTAFETPSITRPFAFRGRFAGTVHVPIDDGSNRVVVEAVNTVGNRGSDSVTVTIQQTLRLLDPPAAGAFSSPKYLDPFTLILQPEVPDSLVLYHHSGAPAGDEVALIETGNNTGVFTANSPELGNVTLTLTTAPAANNPAAPQVFDALLSTSEFAMIDEPVRFVETAASSGVFKTIARRLPDNSVMRVAFNGALGSAAATAATVTLEKIAGPLVATLPSAGTLVFSAPSGALGRSTLSVRSIDGVAGQPRTLETFFSSEASGLVDHYVSLRETGAGTQQFETETRAVVLAADPVPPTPLSTVVVNVVNDAESPESTAEPVWVVAKGLREARVGDSGMLDNTVFELTTAAAPSAGGAASPRAVRFALQVAFLKETGSSSAGNLKRAMSSQQDFDRTTVDATPHEANIRFLDAPIIRRSFSSLAVSKAVVVRGAQTKITATWIIDQPEFQVTGVSASGSGIALSIRSNQFMAISVTGLWRETLTFTATVAKDVPPGSRDLIVSFVNGQTKTFRGALRVSQGRAIVFAIDGLSRAAYDDQVNKPGSALSRLFGAGPGRQVVDRTVVASFPPITFSRWATMFSGRPPKDTLAAGLQWFNRQALIGGTDQFGNVDQWLGTPDALVAGDVFRPGSYNKYFKPEFVYDKLRAAGLRSVVVLQQAGLGRGNSQPAGDDRWLVMPRNLKIAWNSAFAGGGAEFMDELATGLAERELANLGGDIDLLVVYLPGLDHTLHLKGLDSSGKNTAAEYFKSSLDGRLNRIINASKAWSDSTVYGVMADHGHFDTKKPRSLELDENGEGLSSAPTVRNVLQASKNLRVSNAYRSWGNFFSWKQPNVIYDPQFAMANIYVAHNARLGGDPNWRRAPSLDDVEPIVNNLFYSYMDLPWESRPVSDILIRVPGGNDGFDGDHYMVLSRDYARNRSTCGADHKQRCTLADQLRDPDEMLGFDNGFDVGHTPPEWRYHKPAERLADWISPNTGDVVLLGNGPGGYQFGTAYLGQHGSLTLADARVPLAFGFPAASGDDSDDTMLDAIKSALSTVGNIDIPACSGPPDDRRCIEEQALERFFLKPPPQ
jgi:hypothetical protein